MNALVLGCGRIGRAVIDKYNSAGWDVTVIEKSNEAVEFAEHYYDALIEEGSARDFHLLEKLKVGKMDAVIAVTDDDETNILAAVIAKKKGAKYTVARVSDAIYDLEYVDFIKSELGVDKAFSPGRLVAERLIEEISKNEDAEKIKTAIIAGAGNTAIFLSDMLVQRKYSVTIVVKDEDRYDAIADAVNEDVFIKIGNVNDYHLLDEIGLKDTGAFVAVTTSEATNVVLAKYADSIGVPYTAARASQGEIITLGQNLGIDRIISPQIVADYIMSEE